MKVSYDQCKDHDKESFRRMVNEAEKEISYAQF